MTLNNNLETIEVGYPMVWLKGSYIQNQRWAIIQRAAELFWKQIEDNHVDLNGKEVVLGVAGKRLGSQTTISDLDLCSACNNTGLVIMFNKQVPCNCVVKALIERNKNATR